MTDQEMEQMVDQIDAVIKQYPHVEAHKIAGVLLSRVTLLMTTDPETGKGLMRYVWEKLDEIQQADPGNMI
jgi:hypothetical protein